MECCPSASKTLCLSSQRFPILIKSARRASNLPKSYDKALQNTETKDKSTSQRLALAVTVAPLLIPLQAFCQEQTALEQAGSVSPEVVGLVSSTLAIPIVVFGAVSLIQQAKQAKEDKDLRLKAINTHNTFLSQEDEESAQPEQSSSSISSGVAASSPDDNFSSADNPHTATPAMLDHPERPEPTLAGAHVNDSSHARAAEQEASQLPPQTAVLDRPERPEPETAPIDANLSIHQDGTAPILQPQASATSMVAPQAPTSPHSPNSLQQAAALSHCDEAAARTESMTGLEDDVRPSSRQQHHDGQVSDMAAQYAAKLALLHEESAARAKGDLRKRRERYTMLADLQAQAQMARPASPANVPQPQTQNTVLKFFLAVWTQIIVFLRQSVLRVQTLLGTSDQSADTSSSTKYSST